MKNRITFLTILIVISSTCYSQDYLFIDSIWHDKIENNKELAPLFYGVQKTKEELNRDEKFISDEIKNYKGQEIAFDIHYKKAWNYLNSGIIDTAVIEFNSCYLINKNDLRLIESYGNLLLYVNGNSSIENENQEFFPNYTLLDLFEVQTRSNDGFDPMIVFGDNFYVEELRKKHNNNNYKSYAEFVENNTKSFKIDSIGNLCVELRLDNDQGFYSQGKQDGNWIRYHSDTLLIDFKYNLKSGIRDGTTTSFYRSGIKKTKFQHVDSAIEGEFNYYAQNGELVKTEYWKNNKMNRNETIRYKDTPIEGDIIQEKDKNGELHNYMILNGKKILMN